MRLLERGRQADSGVDAYPSLSPAGAATRQPAEGLFKHRQLDACTLVTGGETFLNRVGANEVGVLDLGEGRR